MPSTPKPIDAGRGRYYPCPEVSVVVGFTLRLQSLFLPKTHAFVCWVASESPRTCHSVEITITGFGLALIALGYQNFLPLSCHTLHLPFLHALYWLSFLHNPMALLRRWANLIADRESTVPTVRHRRNGKGCCRREEKRGNPLADSRSKLSSLEYT